MEKPVNEDFNIGWPVLRGMICGVIGLSLLASLFAILRTHDVKIFLVTGGTSLFLLVCGRYQQKRAADSSLHPDTWLLTDAGLLRVYSDPAARELIPWNSIERMRWIRFKGLLLFWNESGPRCGSFRNEFKEGDLAGLYRGVLRVREEDADEVAELWLKHRRSSKPEPVAGHTGRRSRRHLSRQSKHAVLLCLALGLGLLGWGMVTMLPQYASARWPSIPGKIISQVYLPLPDPGNSRDNEDLHLTDRYQVGGQEHYASQYSLSRADYVSYSADVRAIANAYPTGAVVPVHYNPRNPADAVLLAGPDWKNDGGLLLLGAFFVFIWLIVLKAMQAEASKREAPEKNWLLKVYGVGPK